jgi:hypothetical protein
MVIVAPFAPHVNHGCDRLATFLATFRDHCCIAVGNATRSVTSDDCTPHSLPQLHHSAVAHPTAELSLSSVAARRTTALALAKVMATIGGAA